MNFFALFLGLSFLFLSGCAGLNSSAKILPPSGFLNSQTAQIILVQPSSKNKIRVRLFTFEKENGRWQKVFMGMDAVVGRNGVAPDGKKREGDGRVPSGVFALQRAFGYAPQFQTGLEYSRAGENDFWVDDPASNQYNQWVRGPTSAKSFEVLRRKDKLYQFAAVIEYNTEPIVAGNGSAIFLHIWRGYNQSTSGCVALSERNLRRVLKWLDKNKNPQIVILEK